MSLWVFSEDGLTIVDVERPSSTVRAWSEEALAEGEVATEWVVGIPNAGIRLATYYGPDGEQDARQHLAAIAAQLNAGARRPGEAAAAVAERLRAVPPPPGPLACCGRRASEHVAGLCPGRKSGDAVKA